MNIKIKNIDFSYRKSGKVLRNITADFEESSLSVILGPSGCGKSTLLRCIANLETPEKGDITYNGKAFKELGYHGLSMSYIFQDLALYQGLSVKDNITIGLSKDLKKDKQWLGEICEVLKISHFLNRKVTKLSGGEQQKVAIARSLILKPRILLLDEPFSSLDYNVKSEIKESFRALHNELGITSIMVTHHQNEASELADTIFLMKEGQIIQIGNYSDLYFHPVSPFVAEFIGKYPINKLLIDGSGKSYYIRPEFLMIEETNSDCIAIEATFIRVTADLPNYVYQFSYQDKIIRMIVNKYIEIKPNEIKRIFMHTSNIFSF